MTDKQIIRKGNLEYRERVCNSPGTFFNVVLLRCPVCGYEFNGQDRPSHLLHEHTPEDFGLGL